MKIFFAADHAGHELKTELMAFVRSMGYEVEDRGAHELNPDDDYPLIIAPCAKEVARNPGSFGIIIGGSGQGEAMVANREKGIRAAVFYGGVQAPGPIEHEGTASTDVYDIVRLARQHNDANILSIGARFVSTEEATEAVRVFLSTSFSEKEHHTRRIAEF